MLRNVLTSVIEQPGAALAFALLYLKELLISNITVARTVIICPKSIRPEFIEFPTTLRKDVSLLMFGNLVSMTPGTLTVDFDPMRRTFVIHVLDVDDPESVRETLRSSFESRIARFMEPTS